MLTSIVSHHICDCIFVDCVIQTRVAILVNFWIPVWIPDGRVLRTLSRIHIRNKTNTQINSHMDST